MKEVIRRGCMPQGAPRSAPSGPKYGWVGTLQISRQHRRLGLWGPAENLRLSPIAPNWLSEKVGRISARSRQEPCCQPGGSNAFATQWTFYSRKTVFCPGSQEKAKVPMLMMPLLREVHLRKCWGSPPPPGSRVAYPEEETLSITSC